MRKMALFVIYIMLATSFTSVFSIQCIASPPGVPTNFTATTISKTRIDLTWTKGANADKTYIERNSVTSWTIGTGTYISYNTGSSYSDSGLIENTHYYYQAWSWNQTDGLNLNPAHTDNTTFANQPPFFGSPTPSNSSTNNPLSLTWSIPINDLEGNTFTWTIQCSNTQKNNGTAASNGTKSLTLTGLVYFKTYKVWVNATDPTGSGLYTRKWYNFTTKVNNPPNKQSQPSGQANGTIKKEYSYTTSTTDPNGDKVFYKWDWGDNTTSEWLGPYTSGATCQANHTWNTTGTYNIKVNAKDIYGNEGSWSDPLPIKIRYRFPNTILQILEWLFQRFPHAFPQLRQLMGY
jgi:beta-galactosidase